MGEPAVMAANGQQHVFYRSASGNNIVDVFWDSGESCFGYQWTSTPGKSDGLTKAVPARGDPAVLEANNQQHLFYRGTDGHIYHLFWDANSGTFGPVKSAD